MWVLHTDFGPNNLRLTDCDVGEYISQKETFPNLSHVSYLKDYAQTIHKNEREKEICKSIVISNSRVILRSPAKRKVSTRVSVHEEIRWKFTVP